MRIHIDTRNAAAHNLQSAHEREVIRMCMLGWCLDYLGADVSIRPTHWLVASPRSQLYRHLFAIREHDVRIVATPFSRRKSGVRFVHFKTSVSLSHDVQALQYADVYIAHEFGPKMAQSEKLLPIPFPVHDLIAQHFEREGMLRDYLCDNVSLFRERYRRPGEAVGFIGYAGYGRAQAIQSIPRVDATLYNKPPFGAEEYLTRTGSWKAGLLLPGDTPKTNRFSEYALLGVPMIALPQPVRTEPDLTAENCILLSEWTDPLDFSRVEQITAAMTEDYLAGWSILAAARKLLERLHALP